MRYVALGIKRDNALVIADITKYQTITPQKKVSLLDGFLVHIPVNLLKEKKYFKPIHLLLIQ